jgi:hypothetical protein
MIYIICFITGLIGSCSVSYGIKIVTEYVNDFRDDCAKGIPLFLIGWGVMFSSAVIAALHYIYS